jgi:hypothetical protein
MRRHAPGLLGRRGRTDPGKPAVTPYTQRAADLLLAHAGLQPRESLGQGMGPLAARAAYLRRVLSPRLRLHENLIEVHPPATLLRLVGEGVVRRLGVGPADEAWALRRRVLERVCGRRLRVRLRLARHRGPEPPRVRGGDRRLYSVLVVGAGVAGARATCAPCE